MSTINPMTPDLQSSAETIVPHAQLHWSEIGAQKRNTRDALIPGAWRIDVEKYASRINVLDVPLVCGVLSPYELDITSNFDAVDLVEKMRSGTFSVEEVTTAFCKRAAIAQQLTNCLTEIFFNEAIDRARLLDQRRKTHPHEVLGPLFGLPISLKDTYQIPGIDASIGLACYTFKPSTTYSSLPKLLLSLGAVLYCKTNVPQTMMTADSHNNIFGRTTNPANRNLTAGGSTGGEGPLIALRGSILGFGTDLAGSIRIPSLCNGIYGFKPSSGLIPFSGQRIPFLPGWESVGIIASAGPLATSCRACIFALESILRACPADLDPGCLRMPWVVQDPANLNTGAGNPLRVAFVADDGFSTPTPPVRRGLRSSVEKLRAAGVEIVDLKLPLVTDMLQLMGDMFALDGSKHLTELLQSSQEPLVPSVEKIGLLTPGPSKTMEEYYSLNKLRYSITEKYTELWRDHNIDAILMAPAPYTAVPLDSWSTASYTAIFNILDYPSLVIPVGHVEHTDMVDDISNALYGDADAQLYQKYTGPEACSGAPICVQVIGKKQDDQAFTRVAAMIDSILTSS
ncbi:hypothetical protein BP6252_08134 [Coleophoma cylindrospora]|uniref:Amidase domain-containing protein n=1 Tax=Coleophoma cylindrospora TaxID=1849047 RepID=A0A3D8RCF4_9HELO|nr:hypothetical protein BP6252_08134 [Coleophoma cylindrospora]